jgi:DNA-nicking Smr family endonuclease
MSRRITTDDERELFRAVISGRSPIKKAKAPASEVVSVKPKKATAVPLPSGVDGRTSEKLRRGAVSPDAKLDLHGLTEQVAHHVLSAFLQAAFQRGDRLVLVVTGKGVRIPDPHAPFDMELAGRARGVLKTMVPRWLAEPALARLIADRRSAHRRHGGEGALYIYLRKTKN